MERAAHCTQGRRNRREITEDGARIEKPPPFRDRLALRRSGRRLRTTVACALALMGSSATLCAQQSENPARNQHSPHSAKMDPVGVMHGSDFSIPLSNFSSPEARAAFIHHGPEPAGRDIADQRAFYDRYNEQLANRMKARFQVDIHTGTLGGVGVEIVTPKDGVTIKNGRRVLINLHGGAFMWGSGAGGEVEAIPIASLGRIKVVTVNYRLAPEHRFPAASEDVATVYRALLRDYKPAAIGIYGCSAGGMLTAQSLAWFDKVGLPMPGAAGTFCGSAAELGGDSLRLAGLLTGESLPRPSRIARSL
jgi:monoterpene epsilon-lactone hydrolase